MGDRNGDKHKKEQKANVETTEKLLYCLQPTNYLRT